VSKVQSIKDKLSKKGQDGTLTTFIRTPAANGYEVGPTTTHTDAISFVPLPLSPRKDISKILPNTTFVEVSTILMSAYELLYEPVKGSTVTDTNGVVWKFATCGRLAPQGLTLLWEGIIYR